MNVVIKDEKQSDLIIGDIVVDSNYVKLTSQLHIVDDDGNVTNKCCITHMSTINYTMWTTTYDSYDELREAILKDGGTIYSQDEYELQLVKKS